MIFKQILLSQNCECISFEKSYFGYDYRNSLFMYSLKYLNGNGITVS